MAVQAAQARALVTRAPPCSLPRRAAPVAACARRAPVRVSAPALAAPAPATPRRRRAALAPPRASAAPRGDDDAAPTVESLTAAHGIAGSVSFALGSGGLLKAVLTHANGSSAEVHLHGATVTSYCQPSGDEVLFVRPDAVFDGSRPIAGGVPICFPIFGPPLAPSALAQHGFARSSGWSVHRSSADVNPDYPEPCVTLRLRDSEATRAAWPHAFDALLEVTLKRDSLRLDFRVRNNNATEPLDFTAALHSYFEVVDAALPAVRVTGLKGKTYLDKVPDPKAPARRVDDAPAVRVRAGLRKQVRP
jgi:glucose-6-phosphate 1-epimerase